MTLLKDVVPISAFAKFENFEIDLLCQLSDSAVILTENLLRIEKPSSSGTTDFKRVLEY